MKTAKEKAKELVSKYTFFKLPEDVRDLPEPKQCALICVGEILETYDLNYDREALYWIEVEQEIKELPV